MKLPRRPPPTRALLAEILRAPERLAKIFQAGLLATVEGRYVHWDRLAHRTPPAGLTREEWWAGIKFVRGAMTKRLPLVDAAGTPFLLAVPDPLQRQLSEADRDLSGRVELPGALTTPGLRDRYQMSALIEEAITSSQLEGAATTRKVAKDMLRSGRLPRNHDERMIFNNFQAMDFVRSIRQEPMAPELVLRLHRLATEGTLKDPNDAGRMRRTDEWAVYAPDGSLLHTPPPASQLAVRLDECCAFANEDGDAHFIHPIVRSILLHFWIGYDHPFVDGNGRTARALFYWSMLHHGYWLCEYLSISSILHRAPVQYGRSFLFTETDDNDTTYFVLYQMEVLLRAVADLQVYVKGKVEAMRRTQALMRTSGDLNYRQVALLSHALGHPEAEYTVTGHANSHRVTRQTARTDLRDLAALGLLLETKKGRGFTFGVPGDLDDRLRALGRRGSRETPGRRA